MSGEPEALWLPGGGRALFTARAEGNLSSATGAGRERAAAVRERLRAQLELGALLRARQVHGARVRAVATLPPHGTPQPAGEADGQATPLRGAGAMVLVADCVPVALGCRGAVAMLHAGWRGVVAGVLEEGVRVLRELAPGERVEAIIGPCAGACCYEVGPEVHAALGSRGQGTVGLRSIARERLLSAGVARVRDAGGCTICDERFFSHRREGAAAGRQAGIAWLS